MLGELDRKRAAAYAAGDPARLGEVYVEGTPVLRRDRALLMRYRERRLRVRGLRMRVSHLRVRDHRENHVVLVVRERLAAGLVLAVGVRRRLPGTDAERHVLVLRRVAGRGWRIAAARPT